MPGLRKKLMVDGDRFIKAVQGLRDALPSDIMEAREMIKQKDSLLSGVQMEARRIRESAEEEAHDIKAVAHKERASQVDSTEVVRAAQAKADEIKQQALMEAKQITQEAQKQAYRMLDEAEATAAIRRQGADQYARETLFDLEERIAGLLSQIRRGIDSLGNEPTPAPAPVGHTNGHARNGHDNLDVAVGAANGSVNGNGHR